MSSTLLQNENMRADILQTATMTIGTQGKARRVRLKWLVLYRVRREKKEKKKKVSFGREMCIIVLFFSLQMICFFFYTLCTPYGGCNTVSIRLINLFHLCKTFYLVINLINVEREKSENCHF